MADVFNFYVRDNRKINFEIAEPIMREDSGVTDFRFHIPKTLNGLEVSDWSWWFVFVNAKKEKYSVALTLSDDPESPLEFNIATYTVDYAMSIKAGSVQFALEAINAGTGGSIDNEWHTLTYETKVKETLQGNQAEYAETESDIISELLQTVRDRINHLVGGATPEVKDSTADMTEHKKIYVLSTDSNWYYYNGSAWVSGGQYASGITIAQTLTQSGQAADAKVVGDEVSGIKSDIGITALTLDRIGWINGYGVFDTSGTNYRTSDYIQTGGNRHFRLIGAIQPFYTTNAGIVSCFDINQVFIGFALQILEDDGLTEHDFTVLDDTAYICVTTNKWTSAPSLCSLGWKNTEDLYSFHNPESYKIYYGDTQLVNTGKCLKPDLTVVNIGAFNMSDPILCEGATQVVVLNAGDNSYYGIAFFTDATINSDNFLRGEKFTSAITPSSPLTISVPKAAKYVVFSARVNFRAYIAYDYIHYNKGRIIDKVEGITNFADTPYKIVLGGDSVTAGQGGTGYSATGSEIATIDGTTYRRNESGYCWGTNFKAYIENNYNATVVNNGISGTDSSFWNNNKSALIPADTDLFILMIGANDRHSTNMQNPATLRLKLTRYYNNLYEIIRYCDANNIKIILMSPIPSSHDNEQDGTGYVRVAHEFQWNGVLAKLSAFYEMEYINLYNRIYMYALTRGENFESYLTDGLHPNDTGYKVMYYQILDGLGLAPHFDPIS